MCTDPQETNVELNGEKEQDKFDGQLSGRAW